MDDLKRLLGAVKEMRAAQKVEWAALPSNFRIFKRSRQQQAVARLEENVDHLLEELLRKHDSTGDEEENGTSARDSK